MYKNFKRLIAETSDLPMQEQGKEIEKAFEAWINWEGNKHDQIDDVTVVGIKI